MRIQRCSHVSQVVAITIAAGMGVLIAPVRGQAANIIKANNADDLNLGSSWVGGTAPGAADVALWDSTVTGANSVLLGADTAWGGIQVGSPGGLVTIGGANTLSLGTSGVNMGSSAGESLELDSALALTGGQTWSLGAGRTITVDGDLDLGGNRLAFNIAGTTTINGLLSGTASGTDALFISNGFDSGRVVLTNASNSFGGTIEFSNTGSQILEYTSAGALGATTQIQFRNTGGTIGEGSVLLYTGTTDETVSQTLQCDTSIGIRLRSDSVGGSVTFGGGFSEAGRPLYLEGSGTGNNRLAMGFGGTGSLNKRDAGTWGISTSASNSGGTNINAGILEVTGTAVLGGGNITIADGAQLILDRTTTYSAIARVNGPGVMRLRGGSGTISQNTANWVRFSNNNSGGFHLDMGASLSDRGDIVISDIWGDGETGSQPKLTVASLSGYGFFRSDWGGGAGNRTISVDQDSDTVYEGRIIQSNNTTRSMVLEKLGSGSLTLTAAHTINGMNVGGSGSLVLTSGASLASAPVTVGGTALLIVEPGSTVAGTINVADGATLGGSGTVAGATTIAGTHTPGSSPGIQTFTNGLTYDSTATLAWELIGNTLGTAGTEFDQVVVSGGNLTIDPAAQIDLVMNLAESTVNWSDDFWDSDRTWLVVDFQSAGNSSGVFGLGTVSTDSLGQTLSSVRADASFAVSRNGDDIQINYVAVPEPASLVLHGLFGGFMLLLRHRKL